MCKKDSVIGMESRSNKYSFVDNEEITSTRSDRNARLYREVYGKYDTSGNLPLEDNTNEIDMYQLEKILHDNSSRKEREEITRKLDVLEPKKRNIDKNRVYDINRMLEKAKDENSKLKETSSFPKINTSILSTLQNRDVDLDEVSVLEVDHSKEDDLSMTRELKFKGLSDEVKDNALIKNVMPDNDLSLELFQDLKPTEDTIVTKPVHPKKMDKNEEIDLHSGDTKDIDIIKNNSEKDNDFFTNTYEFSEKDFLEDEKRSGIFKIILLFLAVLVFVGVIVYFILTYGFGI